MRKQVVIIEGHSSDYTLNTAGVPQSSIFGSLLFNLYINDIVNISVDAQFIIFADGTTLVFRGSNDTSALET